MTDTSDQTTGPDKPTGAVAPPPTTSPRPVGRPTLYDETMGERMIAFCRDGYSITAFAGEIGVARSTLTEWGQAHPEFSAALSRAKAASARWWEEKGRRVGETGGGPGTATMIVFQLRNLAQDDFADRQQHELSGPGGTALNPQPITITINSIPPGHFYDADGNLVPDPEAIAEAAAGH